MQNRFKRGRISLQSANLLGGFAKKKHGEEKVKNDKDF